MSSHQASLFTACAIACALCCPDAAVARPLGRLFFSAQQRAALEARWRAAQAQGGEAAPSLDGLVWRSAGRSTLWLNGAPQYQKSAAMRLSPVGGDPSRVELRRTGQAPLRLRVGDGSR